MALTGEIPLQHNGGLDPTLRGPLPAAEPRQGSTDARTHIAFVMEQHIGHRTYYENLRASVDGRQDITATFVPIRYEPTGAWWDRIRAARARAPMRGHAEVARGLRVGTHDVTVFNTHVPAVIGGRSSFARPFVVCTDVTPMQYNGMADEYGHRVDHALIERLKHRWNRYVFGRAAAHAPWSNWVRESLIADYGIDPASIFVIPPGVDTNRWRSAEHNDDKLKVLFVGGDFARKGGDVLLRAMSTLPDDRWELRVVTRSAVPRRPGVRVYDGLSANDPALQELYRTSNVFALPSRAETFGISAIEAAAAGLPLVLSAVGGLGELVHEGVTGVAVAPGDLSSLSRALRMFLDDPALRRSMGHAARLRAEREFDAERNCDALVRLACAVAR